MGDKSQLKGALVSWSGGKDSCLALYEIQRRPDIRVEALLTTVTRDFDRISMHGVRRVLLERQAMSLGLPLGPLFPLPRRSSREHRSTQEHRAGPRSLGGRVGLEAHL
jgi:diphthamide synthase (EF-2-diphthine--ammonia ligase)